MKRFSSRLRSAVPKWTLPVGAVAVAWVGLWSFATWDSSGVGAYEPAARTDLPALAALTKPNTVVTVSSVDKLDRLFAQIGYDLNAVRSGALQVPHVLLASVPEDLGDMQRPDDRKAAFTALMLPLVLKANDRVAEQRRLVEQADMAVRRGAFLDPVTEARLASIAREYDTAPRDFALMLRRVDVVPPSLALAQAALESGWGTSRFTREGNAAFGQWTTEDYAGLVPENRASDASHKVRRFDRLLDSVDSYLRNLNTHRAYKPFRDMREALRTEGRALDGVRLAQALTPYAEIGSQYVSLVQGIIRANELEQFNGATLGQPMRLPEVELRPILETMDDNYLGT